MATELLRRWLPIAVLATILLGSAYTIGQQVLRMDGNDPQVQLAEDAATRLGAGAAAADVVPPIQTDVAASLAPWVIVFGPDRKVIASSARLDGKPAEYVISVLDNAPAGGPPDQVTWQPRPGVRAATAAVGFKGGWVVAGRSLRLVEQRVDGLARLALAAWLAAMLATAGSVIGVELVARRLEARRTRQ